MSYMKTPEQWAECRAKAEAFWDRPMEEVSRDIGIPEEDLPLKYRGGFYRWFRSVNIIDLMKERRKRSSSS